MKTFSAKKEEVQRRWYLIDADGKVLGHVASQVATILRGKHKPIYTPHMDTGDHIIVVNARKVRLTGNKRQVKFYAWHSGYPGGFKSILADKLLAQRPERGAKLARAQLRLFPGGEVAAPRGLSEYTRVGYPS